MIAIIVVVYTIRPVYDSHDNIYRTPYVVQERPVRGYPRAAYLMNPQYECPPGQTQIMNLCYDLDQVPQFSTALCS